ncbi:hypothetical protein LOK49_LG01G01232 [Camellia lanceoleosa]|uniref:Uncharacterized protein n=1 Tax=Camellia lanceoleosa TaxID=1840588 RepID=A0ACC0J2U7_9ERIC|nr:hypothetical protein LOK49_LG01G01232 [Camellia lanceoleosa]
MFSVRLFSSRVLLWLLQASYQKSGINSLSSIYSHHLRRQSSCLLWEQLLMECSSICKMKTFKSKNDLYKYEQYLWDQWQKGQQIKEKGDRVRGRGVGEMGKHGKGRFCMDREGKGRERRGVAERNKVGGQ